MDYQEAIHCMKVMADEEVCEECNYYHSCDHTNQADMARIAISAMQELHEYKQKLNNVYGECDDLLRTVVDGLVRHEGIEIGTQIKSRILTDEDVNLWEGYKKLGTLEEVRDAVEKQHPKKPIYKHYENIGEPAYIKIACPNRCRIQLRPVTDKHLAHEHNCCPKCGQKIDWSDVE